ncbi:MAG: DUF4164 family protein [Alphaproteobacteria bacterium]
MTRLDQAKERLVNAVARLEAAVKVNRATAGDDKIHEKLSQSLTEALQGTQAEYASLKDVTRTVSDRLDATIDRLRAALED